MSRALERLREMFGDVLLVRSGRAYERTVRGERVLRELESLMPRLEAMVRGESFEPEGSHERFRVAMTDHAAAMLMPPLLRRVRAAATNVKVEVSVWHSHVYEDVTAGRLDTALSAEAAPAVLEAEVLYEEDFVCLVGSAQRVGTRRFTLKQYLGLPHALVETWERQQTPVDRPLGVQLRCQACVWWSRLTRSKAFRISWCGTPDSLPNLRTHGFANSCGWRLVHFELTLQRVR